MGSNSSRLDRFAGTYEKSFERIEKDVEKLKARTAARAKRRATLSRWCSAVLVLGVAVAAVIIYQVQQQPPGTYTHQQHLQRVGVAMAIPAAAFAAQWMLMVVLTVVEGRGSRKLKGLEAAKRSMIKELKDMTRFDKIKSLIDKYDPDAQRMPQPATLMAGKQRGALQAAAGQLAYPHSSVQQQFLQQQRSQQVPALLMKGSGQVAGAAALAVAGAGKALMPVFDRLATSLISENPVLLEDLRHCRLEGLQAQVREGDALLDGCNARLEAISLKQRLMELEQQLDLPPSFELETLEEQRQQQFKQAQDVQRVQQQLQEQLQLQLLQQGTSSMRLEGPVLVPADSSSANAVERVGAGGGGDGSWPAEAGAAAGGSWDAPVTADEPATEPAASNAPETPCTSAAASGGKEAMGREQQEAEATAAGGSGMGEGQGADDDQVVQAGAAQGLRHRKASAA